MVGRNKIAKCTPLLVHCVFSGWKHSQSCKTLFEKNKEKSNIKTKSKTTLDHYYFGGFDLLYYCV